MKPAQETFHTSRNDAKRSDETLTARHVGELSFFLSCTFRPVWRGLALSAWHSRATFDGPVCPEGVKSRPLVPPVSSSTFDCFPSDGPVRKYKDRNGYSCNPGLAVKQMCCQPRVFFLPLLLLSSMELWPQLVTFLILDGLALLDVIRCACRLRFLWKSHTVCWHLTFRTTFTIQVVSFQCFGKHVCRIDVVKECLTSARCFVLPSER